MGDNDEKTLDEKLILAEEKTQDTGEISIYSILEHEMTEIINMIVNNIEEEHNAKFKKGGRPPKLSLLEMVEAAFYYLAYSDYHDDISYNSIAEDYKIAKSNMYYSIKWVKNLLLEKQLMTIDLQYEDETPHIINLRKLIGEAEFERLIKKMEN